MGQPYLEKALSQWKAPKPCEERVILVEGPPEANPSVQRADKGSNKKWKNLFALEGQMAITASTNNVSRMLFICKESEYFPR